MITTQMPTREPSRRSKQASSRLRAPNLTLWLIGLLAAASACKGTIDNNEDRSGLRPAANAGASGQNTGTSTAAPGVTAPGGGEIGGDNIQGLDGESSAGGSPRGRGGAARPPPADDIDAGVDEPVEADAGSADAGVVDNDAGGLDLDGGLAGDAGSAPL